MWAVWPSFPAAHGSFPPILVRPERVSQPPFFLFSHLHLSQVFAWLACTVVPEENHLVFRNAIGAAQCHHSLKAFALGWGRTPLMCTSSVLHLANQRLPMSWIIGMLTSAFFSLSGLDCVGQTHMNRIAESLQDVEISEGHEGTSGLILLLYKEVHKPYGLYPSSPLILI